MTFGAKDRHYRLVEYMMFKEKSGLQNGLTAEFEHSSGTSDLNTSIDSESSAHSSLILPTSSTSSVTKHGKTELDQSSNLTLQKDFVKDVVLTGVSRDISERSLLHLCTNLVVGVSGNISDFSLSRGTIQRAKKKSIREAASKHRAEVKKCALESNVPIIAHFDGKIMEDITDGNKSKRDRFAVLVNIGGELKLLGIPAMDHGSAEAQ